MSHQQYPCDASRIESYLRQVLDADEEAAFESHLDGCLQCRQRVEQCAADPLSWQEAGGFLGDRRWRDDPHSGMTAALSYPESDPGKANTDSCETGWIEQSGSRQIRGVLRTLAPTDDPAMLGRIAAYEISGVIGFGGMGVVLKGFDPSLRRVVAIKVMAPHLASSAAARQRFSREAQAAAAITHDNVIDIYGVAEADGLPYLVMPYARGPSLQSRIDERGTFPPNEVLRIGLQIASGLAAAHGQGLVHRDIKPANILLSDGIDRLVITDFGLARAVDDASVTKTGVIAGTPQYMSPEQARGETIDQRSDLFSLGSVLYTLCTGRPPFRAETTYGLLQRISTQNPRDIRDLNPSIPPWLCRIIGKLHAKDPAERYESAESVARLFQQCLAHVQQPRVHSLPPAVAPRPSARLGPLAARRAWVMPIATAATMIIAACLVFGVTREKSLSRDATSTIPPVEADASDRLRYRFELDREYAFLLTMSSESPDTDTQLDGLVIARAVEADVDGFQLRISSDLQLSETVRPMPDHSGGLTFGSSGNHWRRWNGTSTGVAVVSDTGDLISQQGSLALPYELGSLPELIIPPLPVRRDATLDSPGGSRLSFGVTDVTPTSLSEDGPATVVTHGDTQIVFDTEAGAVDTVRLDRTITFTRGNVIQRVPIHIEAIRISDAERRTWESEQAGRRNRSAQPTGPLTTDEKVRLVADVRNNRRVLYWLHNLNRRPVASFSRDVVDAVVELTGHSNQTYRTLAGRLVDRIPREQLNPFREVK